MAQGRGQTADGRQKPCEFVSACISARGGREGVKVNPIQVINVCKTCSHVPWGWRFLAYYVKLQFQFMSISNAEVSADQVGFENQSSSHRDESPTMQAICIGNKFKL